MVSFSTPTWFAEAPSMTISLVNGVNPLQTTLLELGIVSGRVALLLRSAEIQPLFGRFVSNTIRYSPPPPLLDICYRACGHGHACAARWLRQKAGIGMGFSTEEPGRMPSVCDIT